ncbi:MAG: SDR family oxidoreductase [Cyclobacteriaceae bacterium]|nr:SDR family oxidoreductase [Cyclobacteriaceae bacterium]
MEKKLIVITGGSKGIGKALVEKFSSLGFDVASCARDLDPLMKVKEEMEARYGNHVHVMAADLARKEEVSLFVGFVGKTGLPVDILVNNTGRFIPGLLHDEPDGVLEELLATNLTSAYHMTRGLVPGMQANRRGHIFNICSTASLMAYPSGGSYCISKFALYGMSKVFREELKGDGIRVTSVLPGATLTASWEGVDLPPDRFVKPEDVAEMIAATYALSHRSVVEDLVIRPQLGDL